MLKEIARTTAAPEQARITVKEAEAAARAVLQLFERWQLTDTAACEILGALTPRAYARWKIGKPGRIDRQRALRLSLLIGIHKGLRIVFKSPQQSYAWITKPNAAFGGKSPAAVMAQGDIASLERIRFYLDAECGSG